MMQSLEEQKHEKAAKAEEGGEEEKKEIDSEFLKTRIDSLELSPRTINALSNVKVWLVLFL